MKVLRIAGTALAASTLALVSPPAAQAASVTQVAGAMAFDTSGYCDAHDPTGQGGYRVHGGLDGCWYITSAVLEHQQNTSYRYSGTELFWGCLGTRCGTFTTTFTFTAQFAPDGTELHGRCHHPITGGTEDLDGAGGVINMHDNPDGSADYAGHLSFDTAEGDQASGSARHGGASSSDTAC